MEFEYRRPDVEQALMNAASLDALEAALQAVLRLASDLEKPGIRGHQMFSPGLDSAVPVIARQLGLTDVPLAKSNADICIAATQLYAVGGHSKVAYDISELIGADHTTLILTDVYGRLRHRAVMGARHPGSPLRRRADVLLGARTAVEKILELYNILAALRPSRIFMLTHHFDMVAQVALWPFRSVVDYLHHADHLPTLGATLPWSAHVDLTYRCHGVCKRQGLPAIYAGLTVVSRHGAIPLPTSDKPPGRLRIATCGQRMKYRGAGSYRWVDFAVAALSRPGAELIHIGETDPDFQAEVRDGLAQAGLDPAAYVFAGAAPDLAAELRSREIDVYLSSYPEGGGKSSVEAMSIGLPPIVPTDPAAPELLHFDFPSDTWIKLSKPAEIQAAIDTALAKRTVMTGAANPVEAELKRFNTYVLTPP